MSTADTNTRLAALLDFVRNLDSVDLTAARDFLDARTNLAGLPN